MEDETPQSKEDDPPAAPENIDGEPEVERGPVGGKKKGKGKNKKKDQASPPPPPPPLADEPKESVDLEAQPDDEWATPTKKKAKGKAKKKEEKKTKAAAKNGKSGPKAAVATTPLEGGGTEKALVDPPTSVVEELPKDGAEQPEPNVQVESDKLELEPQPVVDVAITETDPPKVAESKQDGETPVLVEEEKSQESDGGAPVVSGTEPANEPQSVDNQPVDDPARDIGDVP